MKHVSEEGVSSHEMGNKYIKLDMTQHFMMRPPENNSNKHSTIISSWQTMMGDKHKIEESQVRTPSREPGIPPTHTIIIVVHP